MTGLVDVARRAGVSRSTASRVLSGGGPASPSARSRVLDAAAALGYTVHPVARMLAAGRGTRLVLAIRDSRAGALEDPWTGRTAAAAATVADAAGLGLALRQLPLDCARALGELAADRTVAALVLVGHDAGVLEILPPALRGRTATIGTVSGRPGPGPAAATRTGAVAGHRAARGGAVPGFDVPGLDVPGLDVPGLDVPGLDVPGLDVPGADVDSAAGIGALLRHLHQQGRRRVVLVSGPRWLGAARAPVAAYAAFARAAGLPARVVPVNHTVAQGRAAARRVLRAWPDTDAIVAATDAIALGVLDTLGALGVRVPADVAVTGFDDSPLAAAVRPGLTSATHPVERIAAAAATAALNGEAGTRLFPSRPVLRQTS